ncbi:MAG TPA: hypothetical protein DEA91_01730 [Paenibacillus sp.]|nr:hypothetical protein [Paenibacillus sp.]
MKFLIYEYKVMSGKVTTFIADSTSLEERAKIMGYQAAVIGLGFIIGPVLGGFIDELGIRAPFFFAAFICKSIYLKNNLRKQKMEIKNKRFLRGNQTNLTYQVE